MSEVPNDHVCAVLIRDRWHVATLVPINTYLGSMNGEAKRVSLKNLNADPETMCWCEEGTTAYLGNFGEEEIFISLTACVQGHRDFVSRI